jgi:hypothetical protein
VFPRCPCPAANPPTHPPTPHPETAKSYANKNKRLTIVAQTILDDINANFSSSAGELQRLLPIQR